MAHISSEKDKLIARVRRIAGQLAAVERSLDEDASCVATLQLVAAVRGAVNGLMEEIVSDHVRGHVARPGIPDEDRALAAEELIAVIRRYSK